jgi:pyruvate/2-oxoglutarate/acetoin dehydrogenase E1 component
MPACPAAENGFMGMGVGAAMTGLRPIVEGMNMGFLLLAFNQVRCAHRLLVYWLCPNLCVACNWHTD